MRLDVLEEFAEAGRWRTETWRAVWDDAREPVESLRRAYRVRQAHGGRCRSCPRPCAVGRRGQPLAHCEIHRVAAIARARKSLGI